MGKNPQEIELAVGQIWTLNDSQLEIVQLGKTLAYYRHFKTAQKRGIRIDLKSIKDVAGFLRSKKAKLLPRRPATSAASQKARA